MSNTIEKVSKAIIHFIETYIEDAVTRRKDDIKGIVDGKTLYVGIEDTLIIGYAPNGKVDLASHEFFDSDFETNIGALEHPFTEDQLNKELIPQLTARLLKLIEERKDDSFFDYKYEITVNFKTTAKGVIRSTIISYVNEIKKEQLQERVVAYIDQKILQGKFPTKKLDTFFLCTHLLDPKLYPIVDSDQVIQILDKILELNKNRKEALKEHIENIVLILADWIKKVFLPQYFDLNQNEWGEKQWVLKENNTQEIVGVELLAYTAILIMKGGADHYRRDDGVEFLKYAEKLGYAEAKSILKIGTGHYDFKDIHFKDVAVEFTANDILSTFTISIKEETAENYGKALSFINNLLKMDFADTYSIILKSKVKNYLPINNLGKAPTHRFFANALQYPSLHEAIAQYAQLTMKDFGWYNDIENELCAMPGTYAVYGLALLDKKYFPLVEQFMTLIDYEHQSNQVHFIEVFIEKYGVSPDSIGVITKTLLTCGEIVKRSKMVKYFQTTESIQLLLDNLKSYKEHECMSIVFGIFGEKADIDKLAKKKEPAIKELLNQISLLVDE
ncbi:DUF6138 family protein [Flavobacterium sp. '19STA2R22 D10 B1']|uniref:DUF6138 family protein n=1 Tax=Flavobacterium aerium TaxID=3037261 RepID=UPI00278BBF0B|nr:DUF6138 family protein [Flavobacterium sp. '19STA2R22 D10 B1']